MTTIRPLEAPERPALREFWLAHWGTDFMVARGRTYRVDDLQAFIAVDGSEWAGVVTYLVEASRCEILSIDSLRPGQGIGQALIKAVETRARQSGCRVLALMTTNDNTRALRFYQKLGFELTALRPRAVENSRRLKPSIPITGEDGIPIRDEIDLELPLSN